MPGAPGGNRAVGQGFRGPAGPGYAPYRNEPATACHADRRYTLSGIPSHPPAWPMAGRGRWWACRLRSGGALAPVHRRRRTRSTAAASQSAQRCPGSSSSGWACPACTIKQACMAHQSSQQAADISRRHCGNRNGKQTCCTPYPGSRRACLSTSETCSVCVSVAAFASSSTTPARPHRPCAEPSRPQIRTVQSFDAEKSCCR